MRSYREPDYPVEVEKDPFPDSEAPYDLPLRFRRKRKPQDIVKYEGYFMSSWEVFKSYFY